MNLFFYSGGLQVWGVDFALHEDLVQPCTGQGGQEELPWFSLASERLSLSEKTETPMGQTCAPHPSWKTLG